MARLTFPAATGEPYARYRFDTASGSDTPADVVATRSENPIAESLLIADAAGRIPAFRGPDGVTLLYRKRLSYGNAVLETTPVRPVHAPPTPAGGITIPDGTITAAHLGPDVVQPVNLPRAQKKLATIATAPPARFKWLTYGDSYAQKIYVQIWSTLVAMAGAPAGCYGTQTSGILGGITTNATSGTITGNTTDYTRWPTGGSETYSTGASRTYGAGGASFTADTIKVYYAKEPGAGTFKIQVDGVDAAGHTNISADGTLGDLGIATVTTTAGSHTVTVVNLTGTHTILAIGYESSTVSGLVSINVSRGGLPLNAATATAYSNFQAFLADVDPDLMTLEVKENSSYLPTALADLFEVTAAGAPGMDVLTIGSTPVSSDNTDQLLQNTQMRAAATTAGYAYWDSYAPFGSYQKLVDLGWEGDGLHVSTAADQYRGMLMLRDTGLLGTYGRTLHTGGARVPKIQLGRNQDTTTVGIIQPEQSFGFDLEVRTNRRISFTNMAGTEGACLDFSAALASWIPSKTRLGSNAGPGLWGINNTRIGVSRGDSMSALGDLQARTIVMDPTINASVSGAVTVDLSANGAYVLTLTGNVTSFTFSNWGNTGSLVEVHFLQDATGSRTLAGVNNAIKWSGGAAPTLTTTAGRRDIFTFRVSTGGTFVETSRSMNVG